MCKVLPQELADINPPNTFCLHNDPVTGHLTKYRILRWPCHSWACFWRSSAALAQGLPAW